MANNFSKIYEDIIRIQIKLGILQGLLIVTPKKDEVKDLIIPPSMMTSILFSRYALRMYYHARNFISKYDSIQNSKLQIAEEKTEDEIMVPIENDIYYEFDAFISSAKSIAEEKMHKRMLENIHESLLAKYEKLAKDYYNNFLEPYLSPIRNEVLHLNNLGSSIGSMAKLMKLNNGFEIKIDTDFLPDKKIDLIELYMFCINKINSFVNEMIYIFEEDTYLRYGKPEKKLYLMLENIN